MQRNLATLVLLGAAACGGSDDMSAEVDAGSDAGTTCLAAAEVCDGDDDDCDGTADDGCPVPGPTGRGEGGDLDLIGATTTQAANTEFTLGCAVGEALVGIAGAAYESIDRLAIQCAPATLARGISTPYQYLVAVGGATTSTAHGGTGGTAFASACPANMVVTGARAWVADTTTGRSIYGVQLRCSRLTVGAVGARVLVPGDQPMELSRIGTGNAGLPPSPVDVACPTGRVMTGLTGWYGPWPLYDAFTTVNGLRPRCDEVTVELVAAG